MSVSSVLATAISLMVPILLAALGETIAERAGVINIGLEGMMVAGAYAGFETMHSSQSGIAAVVAAAAAGSVVALIMSAAAVYGRANQIVTGFALFILVPGVIDFLYNHQVSTLPTVPSTEPLPSLAIPLVHRIPVIGSAFFDQNVFWYLAVGLAVVVAILLRRTRFGLELTACGHSPEAASSKGVHVERVRALATILAGALAGLGGAALTVGALGSYSPGVIAGRGFVAIAIVILGRWRVVWVVAAAAAVGLADALRLRLTETIDVPVQLLGLLPWVVVLILLVGTGRAAGVMPRAIGKNT